MTRPIVIAGAGIGGLTAGIALRQRGFTVRVLERAARARSGRRGDHGAGERDACDAAARHCGRDRRRGGKRSRAVPIRRWDGRVLRAMNQLDLVREYGAPFVAIHRGAAAGRPAGPRSAPSHRRDGRGGHGGHDRRGNGATVKLADGSSHDAAFVIGADGLRSTVRAVALRTRAAPRRRSRSAWRGICPRSRRGRRSPAASRGDAPLASASSRSTTARSIGTPSIDSAVSPPEQGRSARGNDGPSTAAGTRPIPDSAAGGPIPHGVIRTELFDRVPIDTWGHGAVTLLGDAAHPMTPNLGQGGCQAIEDAWVLARELARPRYPRGSGATRRTRSADEALRREVVALREARAVVEPVVIGLRDLALRACRTVDAESLACRSTSTDA